MATDFSDDFIFIGFIKGVLFALILTFSVLFILSVKGLVNFGGCK